MELIGIVAVIIVVGFFLVKKRAERGVFRDKDNLKQSLFQLLDDMHDGFLIFTHAKSEKFLQFSKYKRGNIEGIELEFPLASWSEPFEVELMNYCNRNGISAKESFGSDNTKFVEIDFGRNVDSVNSFILGVFSEVFKVSPEDGFHVFLDGNAS